MDQIRVIVVDDHAVVREGTCQLLAKDPRVVVVGSAGSGNEAVELALRHHPDVLLLDLALPDMSGIEVAARVGAGAPHTRIVVLSAYDDDDYVAAALDAGVAGYLLKTAPAREVIAAIHAVADGQVVLHPSIVAKFRRTARRQGVAQPEPVLTVRELEILGLAAAGMHNKEIAHRLTVSIRTVEGHLSHILGKLGVSSRTEAVVYGLSRGWFDLGGRVTRDQPVEPR